VSQILDAPHHFLARRCIDFTDNDLSCMRNSAIAELWHWGRLRIRRYTADAL
jgi:hypothetical protein